MVDPKEETDETCLIALINVMHWQMQRGKADVPEGRKRTLADHISEMVQGRSTEPGFLGLTHWGVQGSVEADLCRLSYAHGRCLPLNDKELDRFEHEFMATLRAQFSVTSDQMTKLTEAYRKGRARSVEDPLDLSQVFNQLMHDRILDGSMSHEELRKQLSNTPLVARVMFFAGTLRDIAEAMGGSWELEVTSRTGGLTGCGNGFSKTRLSRP